MDEKGHSLDKHSIIFELDGKHPVEALEHLIKAFKEKGCPDFKVETHPYNNGYFWTPSVSMGVVSMKNWMELMGISYEINPPGHGQLRSDLEAVMQMANIAQSQAKAMQNSVMLIDGESLYMLINTTAAYNTLMSSEDARIPPEPQIIGINFIDPMTGLATNDRHKLVVRHVLESGLPWIHMARIPADKIRLYIPNGDMILIEAFYSGKIFEGIPERMKRVYRWTEMGAGLKAVNAVAGYEFADRLIKIIAGAMQELWKEELAQDPNKVTIEIVLNKLQDRVKQKLNGSIAVKFRALVVNAKDARNNIEEAFRIQEQLRWAGNDRIAHVYNTAQGDKVMKYKPSLKKELEAAYNAWLWKDAENAQRELMETVGATHPALRHQVFSIPAAPRICRDNI